MESRAKELVDSLVRATTEMALMDSYHVEDWPAVEDEFRLVYEELTLYILDLERKAKWQTRILI